MKILPFPGRQRMLWQRDELRLQSERGRKEEMKRFLGGLLSTAHITRGRMRKVTQLLLHWMITVSILIYSGRQLLKLDWSGSALWKNIL